MDCHLFIEQKKTCCMTDIYEKVSDYFLELASLQRINILFKLLERNRKRLEPLANELNATKQEVHRNLVRLEESGLITKEKDGKYSLTTFGRTMCAEIPSILFLSQHDEYFHEHDFGGMPLKFIMRAGQLATGSHIKGITKTLQKWKSVYSNANEYIYEILSETPEDLFDPILKKIKNGVKYDYILSESAIVPEGRQTRLKKSGFYELIKNGTIERKMQKSVQVVVVLNEKEACVLFPKNGEADITEMFYSDENMFHEWCLDYFRYNWYNSGTFHENKLKE